MGRSNSLKEKTFKAARILFESGSSIEEVADYLNISVWLAKRVKQVESWEEYTSILAAKAIKAKEKYEREIALKKQAEKALAMQEAARRAKEEEEKKAEVDKKSESAQPVSMAGQYQMNRLLEMIKEQNEVLKLLSNKVAYIVDQLV